jgi:hypothetical protein
MTEAEYKRIKEEIESKYREGMAALEVLYGVTNGKQAEPDLGDPAPRVQSDAGLVDPLVGTMSRSGLKTRRYKHSAAYLAKHKDQA